jgi:hypothetical protein
MSHPLVGMWKLVRIDLDNPPADGAATPDPTGAIVYTEQGWMSESLLLTSADGQTRTVIYCGNYKIEGDQVIHQPLFHLDANQIGKDLPRGFEVAEDGQSFVLIATIGRLHWERVK